ncbi:MAG: chorismate lyase [Thiobacillus sp.]|nr:chorismate lyase [Thiobacillus sp.]
MHVSRQGWALHPLAVPRPLRHWLCDRGSLTQRLKSRCANFRVHPLVTGHARPHLDETALLGLPPRARAYVRQVLLVCNETTVVFAHSVLPLSGLRGGWQGITRLGARSLGEALFRNPRIQRQSLEYRCIRPQHMLHRRLGKTLPDAPRVLWARRSRFCLNGHPLLVTEVFLPAIVAL